MSNFKLPLILMMSGLFIVSCGGSSGSSTATNSTASVASMISGSVVKGVVNAAIVNIYAINADGTRGKFLTTAKTDALGNWSASISVFPVEITATGGTYTDESSGLTTKLSGAGLSVILPSGRSQTAITPLTSAMVSRTKTLVLQGQKLTAAITSSELEVVKALGFNPASVIVPNPLNVPANASPEKKKYAKVLLGLTELVNNDPVLSKIKQSSSSLQVIMAVASDMLDGRLNSQDSNGKPLSIGGTSLPILSASGVLAVNTAASTLITRKALPNLNAVSVTSTPQPITISKWDKMIWGNSVWN